MNIKITNNTVILAGTKYVFWVKSSPAEKIGNNWLEVIFVCGLDEVLRAALETGVLGLTTGRLTVGTDGGVILLLV